ncbi:hypothetical protein BDA96_03G057200 [Sorghum bicolor]|uniref:AB hydrolase-1 domain-containing protein n=2 Tax=Sorghum bicolor TaxID=4558 RepID=A0A921R9G6_SORBI|nr:uncharacterized protein LOC8078493 isoform X2 [Sorghum bicolor]EES00239.1 hypothetical protein SORBI_3003G053600 [Sorghum bicolor]KAG0536363.1 hypothetical protein BDA96_03G057200 [Sorghum bicolor]|eukprot:XP_002455119.1 uncharacterized protein LOC8078493 isoform X2 [Sorghum bicolor]
MGFGVVSLLDAVFRRAFTSAGLRPGSAVVDADAGTTVHFLAHRSLLLPPPTTTTAEAEEQKKRPVVVLVHGFGPGPTWQWAAQVGPLSRHFDLVVPTLLFFGASRTRAPAGSVTEASQAAAVAALLAGRHLPGLRVGRPAVHVVGASYGGIVAYHLARALQQHGAGVALGKVVLCDSDVTKGPEDDRALAARGGVEEVTELMVPADTKMMRRLTALSFHRPPMYLPECIARDLLRKSMEGQRQEKIELIKGMTTAEGSQLTPLPQEMLIIWGEFDQIFPLEKAYKVKEKLGEKATVKVIPNSGHLPSQEEPKLFNRVLLEFLLQPSISNGSAAAVAEK